MSTKSASEPSTAPDHGTWTKDGRTVIASTVDEAVRLKFEGWEPAKRSSS